MNQFFGNVIGIVVQNNDPQQRGRVKVFIPHLSMNLYEGWDNNNSDKSFSDLSDPIISEVIGSIKAKLPWANCASPIMGEVGSSYFDNASMSSLRGDGVDRVSDKPSKAIEALSSMDEAEPKNIYTVPTYSNSAKGLFSVPKVGSKVWCFFENGNINHPVYFATSYDKSDWETIVNDPTEYPDTLENQSKSDGGSPKTPYQNKMVISQKGGTIEIVNTDNNESITITQFDGSFKVINAKETKEFVLKDKNTLVGNNSNDTIRGNQTNYVEIDQTETIKGNQKLYVDGDQEVIVKGNVSITIEKDASVEIHGNLVANVTKNASLIVGGKLEATSVGDMSLSTAGKMDLTAAGNITLDGKEIHLNPNT